MPDYRTMFDERWVKAWDLGGKPVTVTIVKVEAGVIENPKEKVNDKPKRQRLPIVWFKGAKKPLGLNKTNAQTIAKMYGNRTEDWLGKTVTIFPTTTQAFGEEKDCIRIKPAVPKGPAGEMPEPPQLPESSDHAGANNREPGAEG